MNKNMPFPPKAYIPYNDLYISCILAGGKNYQFALAENFIRCYIEEKIEADWVDYFESQKYKNYGVFKGFEFTSDNFKYKSTEISDVITHYLDMGYVIIHNVETYYIRNYVTFNQYHSIHSLMIYDYDDHDNFVCRDYFDYSNYSEKLVPKSEITTSYRETYEKNNNYNTFLMLGVKLDNDISCTGINNLQPFYNQRKPDINLLKALGVQMHCDISNNRVCNLQLPYDQSKPKINLEKILFLLKEFVNGDNYVENNVSHALYSESKYKMGIDVFDCIISKLLFYFTERLDLVNMRLIKFIEHHIYMMKERIRIMKYEYGISLSKELLESASQLVKKSEQFTFMIMKLLVKRDEAEMLRTVAFLNKLKINYIILINQLIKEIEYEIAKEKG
ncbi:hypothetical protein AN1V17_06230 [Vallitalea sediminicola]